jgi:hypothetical protein
VLILDTYNILHAGRAAGVGAVDVHRLREWIGASRFASEHVVLVFDGAKGSPGPATLRAPNEPGVALQSKASGISELHAGPGRDADSIIEAILEHQDRLGRGRQAAVVSSDKRLRAAATAARATAIGSAAFLKMLAEDVRKRQSRRDAQRGGRPLHATDEGADPARTDYWLREFAEDLSLTDASSETPSPQTPTSAPEVDLDSIDMEALLRDRPIPNERDGESGEAARSLD